MDLHEYMSFHLNLEQSNEPFVLLLDIRLLFPLSEEFLAVHVADVLEADL